MNAPTSPASPLPPVEIVAPAGRAWEHMKAVLFRPFDLYRWLAIGFTAWLATLADGGGGGGGGGGNYSGGGAPGDWRQQWDHGMEYVRDNLHWLAPLVIGLVVIGIIVGVVLLWLSSRGRFMFLHNVGRQRADVSLPWHAYAAHGNSLFFFRLLVGLIGGALILPLLGVAGISVVTMIRREEATAFALVLSVAAGAAVLVLGLGFALLGKLTNDFLVPVMYVGTPQWRDAWRILWPLLRARPVEFVLYVLFCLALEIATGIATIAVVVLTCCLAGCLLALPYLGTVLFLPVLVFFRSYSAFFLAQFGPQFDALAPSVPLPDPGPAYAARPS